MPSTWNDLAQIFFFFMYWEICLCPFRGSSIAWNVLNLIRINSARAQVWTLKHVFPRRSQNKELLALTLCVLFKSQPFARPVRTGPECTHTCFPDWPGILHKWRGHGQTGIHPHWRAPSARASHFSREERRTCVSEDNVAAPWFLLGQLYLQVHRLSSSGPPQTALLKEALSPIRQAPGQKPATLLHVRSLSELTFKENSCCFVCPNS